MAASITGAKRPCAQMYVWTSLRFHRRQLHVFQAAKGGIRKLHGGTRSMGLSRGTLVKHNKLGLCYVGGSSKDRVSLHRLRTGKRITRGGCHGGVRSSPEFIRGPPLPLRPARFHERRKLLIPQIGGIILLRVEKGIWRPKICRFKEKKCDYRVD